MLMQLGYSGGLADEQYAEHVLIRELNEAAWRTGRLDRVRARELLRQLPSPLVIKDPRFVHTIGQWLPVFEEFRPCLLWLVRDLAELKRSYVKRGEGPLVRGRTVGSKGWPTGSVWSMAGWSSPARTAGRPS
jgi:hypothetical protein